MNYKLSFALGDLFLNKGDAKAADYELTVLRQNYPKEAFYDLMNIVDSHDTVRAIYKFGGGSDSVAQPTKKDFDYDLGKARLKLAATFLMGYPGMPTIYYGDEAGQYGSSDPDCRRTYPWGKETKTSLPTTRKSSVSATRTRISSRAAMSIRSRPRAISTPSAARPTPARWVSSP